MYNYYNYLGTWLLGNHYFRMSKIFMEELVKNSPDNQLWVGWHFWYRPAYTSTRAK
jgi:hypothetical protein